MDLKNYPNIEKFLKGSASSKQQRRKKILIVLLAVIVLLNIIIMIIYPESVKNPLLRMIPMDLPIKRSLVLLKKGMILY